MNTSPEVRIRHEDGTVTLGIFRVPDRCKGIVIFAHGSGSGRLSPRNNEVADFLNSRGLGTLLMDLLTPAEEMNRKNVFDIRLLARRLLSAVRWVEQQKSAHNLPLGFFGASTGGGAALWAAAQIPEEVAAVVSRGGRPDLAEPFLQAVRAPVLLIVGDRDYQVIELNKKAAEKINDVEISLIPGATHLFEEPGTLNQVKEQAEAWFERHFLKRPRPQPTMGT